MLEDCLLANRSQPSYSFAGFSLFKENHALLRSETPWKLKQDKHGETTNMISSMNSRKGKCIDPHKYTCRDTG